MGKSTLFTAIQEYILNNYVDVNVQIVSMDKTRKNLMIIEKERNSHLTNDDLYKRTSRDCVEKYQKEIDTIINGF
jgi:hypothetical protein